MPHLKQTYLLFYDLCLRKDYYKDKTMKARVATIPAILVVVADPADRLQEGILSFISLLNTKQYSFVISNSSSWLSTWSIILRCEWSTLSKGGITGASCSF